jgi:transposase-like protein
MNRNRIKLRNLYKRHHGAIKRVAEEVGVSSVSVSDWLKGKNESPRIELAILREAKRLLAEESESRALRKDLAAAL